MHAAGGCGGVQGEVGRQNECSLRCAQGHLCMASGWVLTQWKTAEVRPNTVWPTAAAASAAPSTALAASAAAPAALPAAMPPSPARDASLAAKSAWSSQHTGLTVG